MVVVARIVELGRLVRIADAAGVGQELACGDRPGLGREARTIGLDRRVEGELALLDELHGGDRGHRLADRGGAVGGVGSGRHAVFDIGQPEAL
jgi:hypothetical protein